MNSAKFEGILKGSLLFEVIDAVIESDASKLARNPSTKKRLVTDNWRDVVVSSTAARNRIIPSRNCLSDTGGKLSV